MNNGWLVEVQAYCITKIQYHNIKLRHCRIFSQSPAVINDLDSKIPDCSRLGLGTPSASTLVEATGTSVEKCLLDKQGYSEDQRQRPLTRSTTHAKTVTNMFIGCWNRHVISCRHTSLQTWPVFNLACATNKLIYRFIMKINNIKYYNENLQNHQFDIDSSQTGLYITISNGRCVSL